VCYGDVIRIEGLLDVPGVYPVKFLYPEFISLKRSYLRVYKYAPEYKHAMKHLFQIFRIIKPQHSDQFALDPSYFGSPIQFGEPFVLKVFRDAIVQELLYLEEISADIDGDAKRLGIISRQMMQFVT